MDAQLIAFVRTLAGIIRDADAESKRQIGLAEANEVDLAAYDRILVEVEEMAAELPLADTRSSDEGGWVEVPGDLPVVDLDKWAAETLGASTYEAKSEDGITKVRRLA